MTDILWVGYPKSYTPGRRRKVQTVYLHYTAGAEGPTTAEAGAAYDKRRTDQVSTGYFTDSLGPALQEVPDGDRSHTTRFHADEIGISIEVCGTVQTRAQWLDPVSLATLRTTAGLVAILLTRHGLAFKRLSVAELRRAYYSDPSITGIADHNTATLAFPEDGGTHTDMGPAFPWDVFMTMVGEALNSGGETMARLVMINDGPSGKGAVYGSSGTCRMGFGGPDPWGAAQAWARFWGAPTTNLTVVAWAQADALLGPDVGTMINAPGGGSGGGDSTTLVPHTHAISAGATGEAVASK